MTKPRNDEIKVRKGVSLIVTTHPNLPNYADHADNPGPRIGFIGAGTLGAGLALALHQGGYRVCAVSSRSFCSAQLLASKVPGCTAEATAQAVADATDLVFITTPDLAIEPVAASVKWNPGQWVVHCCGAMGRAALGPAADQGAVTGAFHPFQTFAGLELPEEAAARLTGVTFAVSAEGELTGFLEGLGVALGGRTVRIADEARSLYHAAAVLSCGYLVTLLEAAVEVWQAAGLTEAEGLEAVMAISRSTLDNMARLGARNGVTGPLVRGDVATVKKHLEALAHYTPEVAGLYRALTGKSLPLALELGLTAEAEAAIRQALSEHDQGHNADGSSQPTLK